MVRFVGQLESLNGKPTDIGRVTKTSVANVLNHVLVGEKMESDDPHLLKLFTLMNQMAARMEGVSLVSSFPFLKYIPGDPFGARSAAKNAKDIQEIFETFVQQGNESRQVSDGKIDNILAAYNYERKRKQDAGGETVMDEDKLVNTLSDMFMFGLDNVTTTISWSILCILHHPEVQEKIIREIQTQVGSDRLPTLHDKNNLPYLSAVIMEAQRIANIHPLNTPRKCNTDTEMLGFKIPKGAEVIFNLDSVLSDPEIMGEDVGAFRPDRFIDASGKLSQREELIPYCLDQRSCPSESFANMHLFLFMAVLFQKFQFLPANAKNLPSFKGVHSTDI